VFDHLNQGPWRWSAADRRLADEMSSYWTNFARSGNPNGRGLPRWPAFASTDGKVLYLTDPISVGPVANGDSLAVLDTVYAMVRGKPFPSP
jgi:para-nitrobenzyl esterase